MRMHILILAVQPQCNVYTCLILFGMLRKKKVQVLYGMTRYLMGTNSPYDIGTRGTRIKMDYLPLSNMACWTSTMFDDTGGQSTLQLHWNLQPIKQYINVYKSSSLQIGGESPRVSVTFLPHRVQLLYFCIKVLDFRDVSHSAKGGAIHMPSVLATKRGTAPW